MFTLKHTFSRRSTRLLAAGSAAIVIGGGSYGIVAATSSGSSAAATTQAATAPPAGFAGRPGAGGGSNARSGPAAGGSVGTVSNLSSSGFTLTTPTGVKVTVKTTSSTTYKNGKASASASALSNGKKTLVLGTTDSTTITATQIILQPSTIASTTSSQVVPFTRGASGASKTVGQIPSSYRQGSGKILGGATAGKATEAALAAYPGGVVDRVVQLGNGQYEVHTIGVNWPHHVFENADFHVIGAND
jgi:hypothetical protein